jgi:ribosomal protein S27AE
MRFIGITRRWFVDFLSVGEPIRRTDTAGLIGFGLGLVAWMMGHYGFNSHFGALMGGVCLGQVLRDRMQRAHERRLAQLEADHDAAMSKILKIDVESLVRLHVRACPRCGHKTYHPTDIKEGYCGACHDWT